MYYFDLYDISVAFSNIILVLKCNVADAYHLRSFMCYFLTTENQANLVFKQKFAVATVISI